MRLFHKTNIDFLAFKTKAIVLTLLLAAVGTVSLVAKGGPKLGIDFTGGAQIILGFAQTPDEAQVRKVVEDAGVKVVSVQRFDKPEKNQVLVRVPMEKREGRDLGGEVTGALTKALFPQGAGAFDLNLKGAEPIRERLIADDPDGLAAKPGADPRAEYARAADALVKARSQNGLFKSADAAAATPGLSPNVVRWVKEKTVSGPFILMSVENVGPQVGKDLRQKGVLAILLSWGAMLTYIALRFRSASFGSAAVLALIHDTWITVGACSIFGIEIGLTEVAALLTLIGYSVNDTVVVYDRIRENLEKSRRQPLAEVVNRSINETLSRTILTSTLTFLVVVVLFLIGGETLKGFSFIMLAGILVGTYSSIYVAAPLVIVWEEWKARKAASSPAPVPAKAAKAAKVK